MSDLELKVNKYLELIMKETKGNLLNIISPSNLDLTGSVTIPKYGDEAFALRPSTTGYNFMTPMDKELSNMAIIRVKLSYATMNKLTESLTHTSAYLMPLAQAAINELARYSTLVNKKVTIELPGTKNKFFRELEDSAGYEIRFVLLHEPRGI